MNPNPFLRFRFVPVVICLVGSGVLLTGCRDDAITWHESVPVTRTLDDETGDDRELKYRMITAIADRPDATWFFKLSGSISGVDGVTEKWNAFLKSVRFETDVPTWDLPEGWKSDGVETRNMSGFSMQMGDVDTGDSEIAISVSSMPGGQKLLPNVNRWRGQLGLRPTNDVALLTDLKEFKNDRILFRVFDARGPELRTRMGGAPFAGGKKARPPAGHPDMGSGVLPDNSPDAPAELEFTDPAGWQAGKSSSMILGRWTRDAQPDAPEIILMTMRSTEESWVMNVNAWAEQVEMGESPDVAGMTESREIAGVTARQIRLAGPPKEPPLENRVVVAVMFEHPSGSGYVARLTGSQSSVEASMEVFDSFLNSISLVEVSDE